MIIGGMHRVSKQKEHDVMFKPRTGEEMERATLHKVPILKYSELCEKAKKIGPGRLLAQMFRQSENNIILLQDPNDMHSGHWISVSRNPRKKEIYFFSTYGGRPDEEKVAWIPEDDLRESGQFLNLFSKGLREAQEHGWEIHYNDHPYQVAGDNTAVCGIYTVAFLRSGANPDEFYKSVCSLKRRGYNPAVYFYDQYFV